MMLLSLAGFLLGVHAQDIQASQGTRIDQNNVPRSPGIDFIGNGYDLLSGNPISTDGLGDGGFRRSPFEFTYDDRQTTGDFEFAIPDKTSSRTFQTCSTDTNTQLFSNSLAYQRIISNSFNIQVPLPGGVSFTLNTEFRRTRNSTDDRLEVYFQVSSTCSVYQVSMGTFDLPDFSRNFLIALALMPVEYDEDFMASFLTEFGTHYINEMRLGGRFGAQISYTRETFQALLDESFTIEVGVTAMVLMNRLNVTGGGSDNTTTMFNQLNQVSSNRTFSIGGQYDVDPNIWQARIKEAPLPLSYTLTRLTSLLNGIFLPQISDIDAKRANVDRAIDDWCMINQRRTPGFSCVPPMDAPLPMATPIAENAIRRLCIRNSGGFAIQWTLRYWDERNVDQASGNSGVYSAGMTRCLDLADSPVQRGASVSARIRAIAGREVGLSGADNPYPTYDSRSVWELHATCSGTTLSISCVSTGFQRVLSGAMNARRRLGEDFDWSNVSTPPSTETTYTPPASIQVVDNYGAMSTARFFKVMGHTVDIGAGYNERMPHNVLPDTEEGMMDMVMASDTMKHFGVVELEHPACSTYDKHATCTGQDADHCGWDWRTKECKSWKEFSCDWYVWHATCTRYSPLTGCQWHKGTCMSKDEIPCEDLKFHVDCKGQKPRCTWNNDFEGNKGCTTTPE